MELIYTGQTAVDHDITAFEFKPPQGLAWLAGQFIQLDLPHNQPDAGGISRFFTIAAAPSEGVIRVVTRRGVSSYKRRLFNLTPGEHIALNHSPAGDVVWGQGAHRRIFIATGVGITPVYAMLAEAARQAVLPPTDVVYFHPRTRLPYENQFRSWQQRFTNLRIFTETSVYQPEHLTAFLPELRDAQVYLCGPMSPTKLLLPPFNIQPRQIHRDSFTGYAAADY